MRYFLAVAEEGHMGRAANRLHLSQPPLTRHIQALEEKIGVALFVRTPKGMTLTDAGHTLLQETPNLLALAQQALERTRLAGQGLIGRLDVGLFGSGVLDVIPRILARFHQARPEVKIVLHNLTKDAQLQALRERRISVGFNRLVPQEADISVETVLREPMVVALAASHPLAVRLAIRPLNQLAQAAPERIAGLLTLQVPAPQGLAYRLPFPDAGHRAGPRAFAGWVVDRGSLPAQLPRLAERCALDQPAEARALAARAVEYFRL